MKKYFASFIIFILVGFLGSNTTHAVIGNHTNNIAYGNLIAPLYTGQDTGYWFGIRQLTESDGGNNYYNKYFVIYDKNGILKKQIRYGHSYIGNQTPANYMHFINVNNEYIVAYSGLGYYQGSAWIYDIVNDTTSGYGLSSTLCGGENKPLIQDNNFYIVCDNRGGTYTKYNVDLANATSVTEGTLSTGNYNAIPEYGFTTAIASPTSGFILDSTIDSVKAYYMDTNDIYFSQTIMSPTDGSYPAKFFYNYNGTTGAFSYDSRDGSGTYGSSEIYIYNTDTAQFELEGNANIQYFDNATNTAYGLINDYIDDIMKPEQFLIAPEGLYYIKSDNSPAIYFYSGDASPGLIEFVSGGSGGTGTGSTGTGTIDYDDTVWDWDIDGDGDVELLNGEIFIGIGNFFKYLFEKLIDFFTNIKNLIEKLSEAFTSEEKTLSFNFIPSANATEDISNIINNNVDEAQYKETVLGKIDLLIKGFIAFFILVIGIAFFIGVNRRKND